MHHRITQIEREVNDMRYEEYHIRQDIDKIKKELVDKTPEHFSVKDLLRSFIGSLFFGFGVIFSGNLFHIAANLHEDNMYMIIIFAIVVLTAEIYFIGYSRVDDKNNRKFGQFWIKRLLAFLIVAVVVAFLLSCIFGLLYLVNDIDEFYKVVIIVSVPCAIGASIGDLLKKY